MKKLFRFNVGFIIHEEVGYNHDFPFAFDEIVLDDLELRNFSGNANVGKTPQGLILQANFSAKTDLECVRCLTQFERALHWSFTELYAFDKRSETESGLFLPDDAHLDLEELIRDFAILEIPINPIHDENCKGLCSECGQNLNIKDCGHKPAAPDSPFAKLKDLLK